VPPSAAGQQPGKVYRIGYLSLAQAPAPKAAPYIDEFRQGLREVGYEEGKNLLVEWRWAGGNAARLPELAADLVRLKVDLIVAATSSPALSAREATSTIPIVMVSVGDPVWLGLVASLARPGGNVTGWTSYGPELAGKTLQLVKEVVPSNTTFAVFHNPGNRLAAPWLKNLEHAARSLAVKLVPLPISGPGAIEEAFRRATTERAGAAIIGGDPMLNR
jgi:putative ABC transport system substrate-binding protein